MHVYLLSCDFDAKEGGLVWNSLMRQHGLGDRHTAIRITHHENGELRMGGHLVGTSARNKTTAATTAFKAAIAHTPANEWMLWLETDCVLVGPDALDRLQDECDSAPSTATVVGHLKADQNPKWWHVAGPACYRATQGLRTEVARMTPGLAHDIQFELARDGGALRDTPLIRCIVGTGLWKVRPDELPDIFPNAVMIHGEKTGKLAEVLDGDR